MTVRRIYFLRLVWISKMTPSFCCSERRPWNRFLPPLPAILMSLLTNISLNFSIVMWAWSNYFAIWWLFKPEVGVGLPDDMYWRYKIVYNQMLLVIPVRFSLRCMRDMSWEHENCFSKAFLALIASYPPILSLFEQLLSSFPLTPHHSIRINMAPVDSEVVSIALLL